MEITSTCALYVPFYKKHLTEMFTSEYNGQSIFLKVSVQWKSSFYSGKYGEVICTYGTSPVASAVISALLDLHL